MSDFELGISPREMTQIFICTMLWLKQYGWITIGENNFATQFNGVQLTEKALCALNWMPETVKERGKPLGQRLQDALAERAPASVAGALVGEAVKAMVLAAM